MTPTAIADAASQTPAPRRFLVPGTFDPITRGHLDVIERASRLCDEVIVAVAESKHKRGGTAFTLEERVQLVREATAHMPSVSVMPFQGLLVTFARSLGGVTAVVKGLRLTTDFEYELQQADLNARLAPDIESIFVMSSPELGCVSSSVVRELAALGGNVGLLVPPCVERRLRTHYGFR